MHIKHLLFLAMTLSAVTALPAYAVDADYTLNIKNHQFEPAELKVPSRQKIKLIVNNRDDTPEEFESYSSTAKRLSLAANRPASTSGHWNRVATRFLVSFTKTLPRVSSLLNSV